MGYSVVDYVGHGSRDMSHDLLRRHAWAAPLRPYRYSRKIKIVVYYIGFVRLYTVSPSILA
jgi:hypothetical protein